MLTAHPPESLNRATVVTVLGYNRTINKRTISLGLVVVLVLLISRVVVLAAIFSLSPIWSSSSSLIYSGILHRLYCLPLLSAYFFHLWLCDAADLSQSSASAAAPGQLAVLTYICVCVFGLQHS